MQTRTLGPNGPEVSALGLGCMGMSHAYGPADRGEAIATIHAALDAGVTYVDTGDFYGMGHNELLVAEALKGRRDQAFLAVKYGAMRGPDGAFIGVDTRPAATRNFLAYSLERLGTDHIDLYQPARLDPHTPIEETVGALAELVKAGYIRHIGLSEVGPETLRRAQAVHPIAALQIEYSVVSRTVEDDIVPTLDALGIGMTAYGVVSRGLLTGKFDDGPSAAHFPRFAAENRATNQALYEGFKAIADDLGITPARLATAWVLTRGKHVVPLIGSRRRATLEDSLGALDVVLTPDVLARIEAAVPKGAVAGERYAAPLMAMLDSERPAVHHGG